MSYYEYTSVVAGAVNENKTFDTWEEVENEVEAERAAFIEDGEETEIYILLHEHDYLEDDDECACAQYETDHNPDYRFKKDEEQYGSNNGK
jgi:hypothetical protein